VLSLVLALAAAAATWGFVHAKHPVFKIPSQYDIGMGASYEARAALVNQMSLAERKNATLVTAVAGGLLAAAVALATPGCCMAVLRLLFAIPWGACWGAGTGYIGAVLYQTLLPSAIQPTVMDTAKVQGLFFALLGAGIGLMVGILYRSLRSMLVGLLGGAIAGGIGAVAYPIVAAVAMAAASTEGLIPEGTPVRLLWLSLPFACIGFATPTLACPVPRREPAAAQSEA
jgi:hypothetical protein